MEKIKILPRIQTDISHLKEKIEKADISAIGHFTEFGFMNSSIHAMNPYTPKLYGNAITVRVPAQDSKAVHLAISMAQEGDVVVIDRCQDQNHSCLGEMTALCAKVRKLAAIIVDGPIADYEEILEIGIPVFATGVCGMTTKFANTFGEINEDISCGGIPVHPGDLIMADKNGVLVLRPGEIEELIDQALADQTSEKEEKLALMDGKTLQELYIPEYAI